MPSEVRKKISIIVAIAENNAIGKDNLLLWKISDDLKRFKALTSGHRIIMGRNTFLSLPKGALPNRTNIVISDVQGDKFDHCITVHSVEEALSFCDEKEESFIIGGGMIYRQFLPYADRLYLTKVHKSFEADTYFPEIQYDEWNEVKKETFPASDVNEYPHTFIICERK